MENEKIENNNTNPEPIDTPEKTLDSVEKSYYEDLYNDLPKEVVDILMQTHPLMGKKDEDPEAVAYRTKRPRKEELDAVRQARMEQVNEEIREMKEAQEPAADEHRNTPKRLKKQRKKAASNDTAAKKVEQDEERPVKRHKKEEPVNTMDYEDEGEEIQLVKIKPDNRKPKMVEIENVPSKHKKKSKKAERGEEEGFIGTFFGKKNDMYEDFDLQERAKKENLDCLYEEAEDEEDIFLFCNKRKTCIIAIAITAVIFLFLIFKCISQSYYLARAEEQISTHTDISTKYEELQLENLALQDEIKALKGGETTGKKETDGNALKKEDNDTTKKDETAKSTASGKYETYTTKLNDTYWDISQHFYGNGAYFTRILEANGLKESDPIHEGQQLKIPKQ